MGMFENRCFNNIDSWFLAYVLSALYKFDCFVFNDLKTSRKSEGKKGLVLCSLFLNLLFVFFENELLYFVGFKNNFHLKFSHLYLGV